MADTAERSEQENQLGTSMLLHTVVASTIGLILALVGIEYQGIGKAPFKEHRLIMSVFIMVVLSYAIALVKMILHHDHPHHHNSVPSTRATSTGTTSHTNYRYIFLIDGTLACELLVYVYFTSLKWFLITNGVASIFLGVLHYSCRRQIDNPPFLGASSNVAADHHHPRVHKLYEWTKHVFSRSPAPNNLDPTTEQHAHRTKCMPSFAYLGLNGKQLLKHISGRLRRDPTATSTTSTSVEYEGQGDVQLCNMA